MAGHLVLPHSSVLCGATVAILSAFFSYFPEPWGKLVLQVTVVTQDGDRVLIEVPAGTSLALWLPPGC